MREILEIAVKAEGRIKLGTYLAEIGQKLQLTEEEFALFESGSKNNPARVTNFE